VRRRLDAVPELTAATGPQLPVEIDRLRQVDWLPVALTLLLGAFALLAVGHGLVTGVRRRRRELALLKTLGFVRRQVRATIGWQATALAAIGIVVGVPLGLVAGTLVWRAVADGLGSMRARRSRCWRSRRWPWAVARAVAPGGPRGRPGPAGGVALRSE
jgi:predicted lysophospholipase L1 biosynthesis ABC-type transport system permease subunit